ncbi:hypothetical protein [Virgibacillus halodenitrificans]|uniref:hypothetical protein n=1 Tax=Virgibacillus halodenitrificans TaxID=1482 RepID=UPI000EF508EA|nr:hypothetical protein [Virgibacillus halodenitrificans]
MNLSKEKKQIYQNFKKCIDERSLESMKKPLYQHLNLYCSFIAHYSIEGFKYKYSDFRFLDFINNFLQPYFQMNLRYSGKERYKEINELNYLMQQYIIENSKQIQYEFENRQIRLKVEKLRVLAEELGYYIVSKEQGNKVDINTTIESDGQISLF